MTALWGKLNGEVMSDFFFELLYWLLPWKVQLGCLAALVLLIATTLAFWYIKGGY